MSAIKKLAGQTAVYGVSSILGRLLNYALVPLHTKFFHPEEYGIVSEFYAYVAFFVVFLLFGMETTFFRFVNKSEDKEKSFNQVFSIVFVVNAVFLVSVFLFSKSIANWMLFPKYQNYVLWFAIILAVDAMSSIFLAKLRYEEKPKEFAIIQLSSIGINIVLNLIFIFGLLGTQYDIGIGFIFLANLIATLAKPAFLYKYIKQFRFIWDKVVAKSMIVFALPLVIAGFAGIINETLDRILLKRLLSDKGIEYAQAQVGIYSANYKLSILITIFIQAFRYAAEPFFFAQEKNQDKTKVYSKVMTWFVIVVTFIFLAISLNLDIFKYFIPNEEYWSGLTIVPVLLLANVCLGVYYNQSIWYKLADKTMYGAYIAIGGAFITILLNVIFIPAFGFVASAWTTLLVYFSMMVASYILGQRIYPIKYNMRKIGLYIFSSIGLYFAGYLLTFENATTTFVVHSILILVFIGIVMFIERPLQEFKKKEID